MPNSILEKSFKPNNKSDKQKKIKETETKSFVENHWRKGATALLGIGVIYFGGNLILNLSKNNTVVETDDPSIPWKVNRVTNEVLISIPTPAALLIQNNGINYKDIGVYCGPTGEPLPYSLINKKPTVSFNVLRNELKSSPLSNEPGAVEELWNEGIKSNINPAVAFAQFKKESSLGTQGLAVTTKSIGNIRWLKGDLFPNYQGFKKYPNWIAGIDNYYTLAQYYRDHFSQNDVREGLTHYAPFEDGNNPVEYYKDMDATVNDLQTKSCPSETK